MNCMNIFGRYVVPITSEEGQCTYYNYRNQRRHCCYDRCDPVIKPTRDEAVEYQMLSEKYGPTGTGGSDSREYRRYLKLKNDYDWRTQRIGGDGAHGLISPLGDVILPSIFSDVFTQYDAILSTPRLIPVTNGEGWGLVTPGENPLLIVDFKYSAIIPERWNERIFFVQDMISSRWGALVFDTVPTSQNKRVFGHSIYHVRELMPAIADEIYEDELLTDCAPTTFWMVRIKDKVGILTDSATSYSQIIYKSYETDDDEMTFRLIADDGMESRTVSLYNPAGLFI